MIRNPKGNPSSLGVTPLGEGQRSALHRSRANAEALAWWSSLDAAQRGEHIEKLFSARPDKLKEAIRLDERAAVVPLTPEVQALHDQIHELLDRAELMQLTGQPEPKPKKTRKKPAESKQATKPEQATEKPAAQLNLTEAIMRLPRPEKPFDTSKLPESLTGIPSLSEMLERPKVAAKREK